MNVLASDMHSGLPVFLLWMGALFLALTIFGRLMKKRRDLLTDALKKHVTDKIGDPNGDPSSETNNDE
jgi:hypothetical protein